MGVRACDFDRSTSIFAAGCCTVIFCKMVAPSFVISTSPSGWTTCRTEHFSQKMSLQTRAASTHKRFCLAHAHHLVHATRTETCSHRVCDCLCCLDIRRPHVFLLGIPSARRSAVSAAQEGMMAV